MKYYKKFDTFINEAAFKSDHDFNIVDMLSPIFKGIGGFFNKTKLYSIQTGLDNYLSNQYNEFLKEKKTNNGGDTKKINVENLSKEDDLYVNGPKQTKNDNNKIESEPTKTETPKTIDNDDISSKEEQDEVQQHQQTQESPKAKESPIVINKKSQYVTGDEMNSCEEILNDLYNERDITGARKGMQENAADMRESENIINKYIEDLKPIKTAKSKAVKELLTHKPGSVEHDRIKYIIDNSNKQIKKTEDKIEQEKMRFENAKWWTEQYQNNLSFIVDDADSSITNESIEIKPDNWDSKKTEALRKTINPFQIDEFFIRAEIITAGSKNESLKGTWQLLVNQVAKKWYWAYGDIKTLKNPTSSYTKDTKDLSLASMAIETIYPNSKKVLVKDVYQTKGDLFILKNVDSMTLLKKKEFEDKKCEFYILGDISVNENKKFILKPFISKNSTKIEIVLNKKKYEFINDDMFPIIYIKDNYINDKIELLNTDLQLITESDFKQILKDSNINSFVLPEKNKEEKK